MLRARATILYSDPGAPGVITMYGVGADETGGDEGQFLMSRLQSALDAGSDLFSSGTTFQFDSFVDIINPATGVITDTTPATAVDVVGSSLAAIAPPATAMCVTWKTAAIVAGRRLRGRTFLSPLYGGVVQADGTPTAAAITAAEAFADQWIDDDSTTVKTVVWHRPVGGSGGSTAEINAYIVRDKFAVLRSRRD